MIKEDCIFCKLANGAIPTRTLYEDEDFRVFMDASPATRGHCLIVPKNHYADLSEIDDDVAAKVMPLAKKMMLKLKRTLNCDGFNVVQNNAECAGQTVFHFHVHLIPRYNNDGQSINWVQQSFDDSILDEIMDKVNQDC